jgi:hypothetical protein
LSESRSTTLDDVSTRRIVDFTLAPSVARNGVSTAARPVSLASLLPDDGQTVMDFGVRSIDVAATGDPLVMIAMTMRR